MNPVFGLDYLCNSSSKLATLIGIIRYHCVVRDERILVIMEWPLVSWLVEIACFMTGVSVETIHSDMGAKEREIIIDSFNDAASSLRILVRTSRLIGQGQNVQKSCHVLVVLEPQANLSLTQQIIGRVYRLGQTSAQIIYLLTAEYSYDSKRLAASVKKFLAQQMSVAETGREQLELAVATRTNQAVQAADPTKLSNADEVALRAMAVNFITGAFQMPRDFLQTADLSWADLGIDPLGNVYTPLQRFASLRRLKEHGNLHYKMPAVEPTDEDKTAFKDTSEFGAPQTTATPKSHHARKLQLAASEQAIMAKCPFTFLYNLPFMLADASSCTACTDFGDPAQCVRCCRDHYLRIKKIVVDDLDKRGIVVLSNEVEGSLSSTRLDPDVADGIWAEIGGTVYTSINRCVVCRPKGGLFGKIVPQIKLRMDAEKEAAKVQARQEAALARQTKAALKSKFTSKELVDSEDDEPSDGQPEMEGKCLVCYLWDVDCNMADVDDDDCCRRCGRGTRRGETRCYVPCSHHALYAYSLKTQVRRDFTLRRQEFKKAWMGGRDRLTKEEEKLWDADAKAWTKQEVWQMTKTAIGHFCRCYQGEGCEDCSKRDWKPAHTDEQLAAGGGAVFGGPQKVQTNDDAEDEPEQTDEQLAADEGAEFGVPPSGREIKDTQDVVEGTGAGVTEKVGTFNHLSRTMTLGSPRVDNPADASSAGPVAALANTSSAGAPADPTVALADASSAGASADPTAALADAQVLRGRKRTFSATNSEGSEAATGLRRSSRVRRAVPR